MSPPEVPDVEKKTDLAHSESYEKGLSEKCDYHGIDTRAIPTGTDHIYERKVAVMNQALIDMGMGPFQWQIFALTGFGWFVDNVRLSALAQLIAWLT